MNIDIRGISIGDWVKVWYESYNRFEIERLTNAHFNTHTLLKNIYPIELTPKVLKRLGFGEGDAFSELSYNGWTIQCDCKHIRGKKDDASDMYSPWFELPCRYVHEMQHIFRLAGIKMDFELS